MDLPDLVPYGATAVRPEWNDLPSAVRAGVEAALGGAVVDAVSAGGGFTGGFASVLRTVDGRRCFVKAADATRLPVVAEAYRREAWINTALPGGVPVPRVRWSGEFAGWSVVVADAVPGRMPTLPVHDHLDDLAALEAGWPGAAGVGVVHGDLRPDNLLVGDGEAWICDWNWPMLGATWVDLVCLLPTVHASGLDASAILAVQPAARDADRDVVDGVLAGLATRRGWRG